MDQYRNFQPDMPRFQKFVLFCAKRLEKEQTKQRGEIETPPGFKTYFSNWLDETGRGRKWGLIEHTPNGPSVSTVRAPFVQCQDQAMKAFDVDMT